MYFRPFIGAPITPFKTGNGVHSVALSYPIFFPGEKKTGEDHLLRWHGAATGDLHFGWELFASWTVRLVHPMLHFRDEISFQDPTSYFISLHCGERIDGEASHSTRMHCNIVNPFFWTYTP